MSKLYACLYVCDFPVAVRLRERPNRQTPPALVFGGTAPNAFVHAANEGARQAGVREGMPLSQAEARFLSSATESKGKLLIQPRDEQAEQQAQRELLELALTISPSVENSGPGLLLLDLTGLPASHAAAETLADRVERLGFPANVAVSQNRFAAVCAAKTEEGITHVFPHEVRGFLNQLPVDILPLADEEKRLFGLWGISTVGEFARLPRESLATRFGERGALLSKLARGEDETGFKAWEFPRTFEESLDFDWEVSDLDSLSFPLTRLLRTICERLRRHGSAAEAVRVSLKLADGSRRERTVSLAHPLTDAEALLKLIRLDLSAHPPGDAVEGVRLVAKPVPQRTLQHHLFVPARPSPEKLAVTLARLADLVGTGNVGAPAICDTHRPRAFAMKPFSPSETVESRAASLTLGFRCFRPPVEAEVIEEQARPAYLSSRVVDGRIRKCAGPWRTNGSWWSEQAWSFEEWDVELSKGVYRLCCEAPLRDWRLVGAYD